MQYSIKAMTLTEILDQAVALTRNHFKEFLIIILTLYGPFVLIQSLIPLFISPERPMAMLLPIGISTLVMLAIAMPLSQAAIVTAITGHYLGQPVRLGVVFRHAVRFIIPLVITGMLLYLLIGMGLILLILPGLYIALRGMLVIYVVVIEDIGYFAAISRSFKLMSASSDIGIAFCLSVMIFIISAAGGFIAGLIPVEVISAIVASFIQCVIMILSAAAFVVLYFSTRCKHENFDLQILAEQMQQAPAE